MPKLKNDPIVKEDLDEYLNSCSDFSFELSVLKMLRENSISCEHGGLYDDPITGKSREFDIRAKVSISKYRVRLAIECKNIRDNFPVLISCLPRNEQESYHQIAIVGDKDSESSFAYFNAFKSRAMVLSITGKHSIYKPKDPVGKSTAQVGRAFDGSITANDGDLYDKWSQALSSSTDLISRMYWDGGKNDNHDFCFSTTLPIVVVPNGRLWSVWYDNSGNIDQEPSCTDHCSCFIDKDYQLGDNMSGGRISVSHIEIMTYNGLSNFVNKYLKTEDGISLIFIQDGIVEAINRKD